MYNNTLFTHSNEPEKEINLSESIPNFPSLLIFTKIWIKGGRKSGKVVSAFKLLTLTARSDKGLERGGGQQVWTFISQPYRSAAEPWKCLSSESRCLTLRYFKHKFMVESLALASPLVSVHSFRSSDAHHAREQCKALESRSLLCAAQDRGPSTHPGSRRDALLWWTPEQLQPEQGPQNKAWWLFLYHPLPSASSAADSCLGWAGLQQLQRESFAYQAPAEMGPGLLEVLDFGAGFWKSCSLLF